MRLFLLVLPLLLACRKPCPTCPTIPVRPVSEPAIVQVVPDRPPCNAPPRPAPPQLVGFPSPDGQQICVSKSDMAGLVAFLVALGARMDALEACLQ